MNKKQLKRDWKKIWHFIWHEDSIWSWIVNIVLAFVLIKFIVYPGLGLALGTGFPIVAVVSSSMEHQGNLENWWGSNQKWYEEKGINFDEFKSFPFKTGFNKGDIMVLIGKSPEKIKIGDIIVFKSSRPDPIIHRVIRKWDDNGYRFHTKGDNNPDSIKTIYLDETNIPEDKVLGVAVIRIPLLGYVKIWFVDLINLILGR
ncbi:MAG: signal peptidase I [Nanoarchaeota archaeon]|nr:signal peptidase I [Nanoarchaeota archaeon]